MNKQETIDKIYEVVATKRKEYCKLCPRCNNKVSRELFSDWDRTNHEAYECKNCGELSYDEWEQIDNQTDWFVEYNNPVYIGNIISYIKTVAPNALEADLYMKWNKYVFEFENVSVMELLSLRDDMNMPIDKQNEWCINYVYDLITKK